MTKPTRLEFAALVAAITFVCALPVLNTLYPALYPSDYETYRIAGSGQLGVLYYPQWIAFLLAPLTWLPFWIGFIWWSLLNIACVYVSAKLWGGNVAIALLAYPLVFSLYYGQIIGILVLCLTLYVRWINERPLLAGVCAAIALAKPQLAIPFLLVATLQNESRIYRYILLVLPSLLLFAASLLVYGDWVSVWIHHLPTVATEGSITLWYILDHWALLLWIPIGWIQPKHRLAWAIATTALTMPYYQLTGLVLLLVMPIPVVGILAFTGYMMAFWGWFGASLMVIYPIAAYILLSRKATDAN
jgi:hypothetical protein